MSTDFVNKSLEVLDEGGSDCEKNEENKTL